MRRQATAYYNEVDPFAAEWLRNLINAGVIAYGFVDERSVEDVTPNDLQGFTQCHFFAGLAVWSYALRLAGWPDNRPVWTGSCPCQPFSQAGKGEGFSDERHLWPAFFWLISQCQPERIFGEQVAASNADVWFDLVQADLEALDYTFGIVPFAAAGVGAPNVRERAYWMAHSSLQGLQRREPVRVCRTSKGWTTTNRYSGTRILAGRMADTSGKQHQNIDAGSGKNPEPLCERGAKEAPGICHPGRMANPTGDRLWRNCQPPPIQTGQLAGFNEPGELSGRSEGYSVSDIQRAALQRSLYRTPAAINSQWNAADWLLCRDARWRPVESQSFPLVNGLTQNMGRVQPDVVRMARRNRTGRLKGYGNALNAIAAAEFIHAYLDIESAGKAIGGKNDA